MSTLVKWLIFACASVVFASCAVVVYVGYLFFRPVPAPVTVKVETPPPVASVADSTEVVKKVTVEKPEVQKFIPHEPPKDTKPAAVAKIEKFKVKAVRARRVFSTWYQLVSDKKVDFNLCSLRCEDLNAMMSRSKGYLLGENDGSAGRTDPAYHFAKMGIQASIGGNGVDVLKSMDQVMKFSLDPESVGELKKVFEEKKGFFKSLKAQSKKRKKEFADLKNLLKNTAHSCNQIDWQSECSRIQGDIDSWVSEGEKL